MTNLNQNLNVFQNAPTTANPSLSSMATFVPNSCPMLITVHISMRESSQCFKDLCYIHVYVLYIYIYIHTQKTYRQLPILPYHQWRHLFRTVGPFGDRSLKVAIVAATRTPPCQCGIFKTISKRGEERISI